MQLNKVNWKTNIYSVFILVSIIINMIIYPNLLVVQIFLLIYLVLVYKKFNMNFNFVQLSMLLLFSIVNANFYFNIGGHVVYYFYILIAIYYFNIIGTNIINLGIYKSLIKLKNKYIYLLSFISLYIVLSTFLADNRGVALNSVKNNIIMISLLCIFIFEFRKNENLDRFIDFFISLTMGILALGFYEILGFRYGLKNHFDSVGFTTDRFPHIKRVPVTFFYNPNNYAVFLVIVMIILIVRYIYSKDRYSKVYNGTIYLLSLINIVFSMCRTAWISLIITLVFSIIFYILHNEKEHLFTTVKITVITIIILAGLAYIPFMKPYYGKFKNMPKIEYGEIDEKNITDNEKLGVGKRGSENVRLTLIYDVVNGVFKEKKYLGFGPGNTSLYVKSLNNTFGVYSLHSFWMEILGDFGIPIFLLTIFIYLYVCIKLILVYNKYSKGNQGFSFMLGLLMFSLIFLSFAPSSVMNFPLFWIVLGMPLGFILNK